MSVFFAIRLLLFDVSEDICFYSFLDSVDLCEIKLKIIRIKSKIIQIKLDNIWIKLKIIFGKSFVSLVWSTQMFL